MSNLSLFAVGSRFVGAWNSSAIFNSGDVAEGSDGTAYRCKVTGTTGVTHNPTVDITNWGRLIPGATPPWTGITATTTGGTAFGIGAGSTVTWPGNLWTVSVAGTVITLKKVQQQCTCNCNCDCSSFDCNCQACVCTYTVDCPPNACGQSGGLYVECLCTDCNCTSNCNCNCTPI